MSSVGETFGGSAARDDPADYPVESEDRQVSQGKIASSLRPNLGHKDDAIAHGDLDRRVGRSDRVVALAACG
jgi:hypothetical protein